MKFSQWSKGLRMDQSMYFFIDDVESIIWSPLNISHCLKLSTRAKHVFVYRAAASFCRVKHQPLYWTKVPMEKIGQTRLCENLQITIQTTARK